MDKSLSIYTNACIQRGGMKNVKNVKKPKPLGSFTFFTFFTQSGRVHVRGRAGALFTFFTFFTRPGCVHARRQAGARLAAGRKRGSFLGCPYAGNSRPASALVAGFCLGDQVNESQ